MHTVAFTVCRGYGLKTALSDLDVGLEWIHGSRSCDFDYADDIVLLDSSHETMQKMTTAVGNRGRKLGLHMKVDKCKIMISNDWVDNTEIQTGNAAVEMIEEFCYLRSYVTSNSSCDKDCQTRIGKASSVFGRLKSMWKNRHISTTLNVRLFESLVMSTMLYGAELWPLTVAQKKLEAAHHKFQRRIMNNTSWKDKVSNERVRAQTQLEKIDLIIKERRLGWLGHVLRIDDNRLPSAKTSSTLEYKRYKKKAWKTTKELDRHHTTRFEKHRHDLASSATARRQQRRLASTCGSLCL